MEDSLIELSWLNSSRVSKDSDHRLFISNHYVERIDQRKPECHQQHEHNISVPMRLEEYVKELLIMWIALEKDKNPSHPSTVASQRPASLSGFPILHHYLLLILFPGRRLADSKGVNRDINHLESQGKLDSNESNPPQSEHVVSLGDLQFYPSSVCVVCSINRQVVETSIVLDFSA